MLSEEQFARDKFEECVLVFVSEEEKQQFKEFAISKWDMREEYLEGVSIPIIQLPERYNTDVFKEDYENALI